MNGEGDREGDSSEAEDFWEDHYRRRERVWSGEANAVLVDVAASLSAATALDLGCGEGGDAIWLAKRDWQVTAVDVSVTALERASIEAAAAGVEARIDFQQHDLALSFPAGAFHLVSAQYLQSPLDFPRDHVLQAAARAVTPVGCCCRRARLGRTLGLESRSACLRGPGGPARRARPGARAVGDRAAGRFRTSRDRPDGQSAVVADNVIAVRRAP